MHEDRRPGVDDCELRCLFGERYGQTGQLAAGRPEHDLPACFTGEPCRTGSGAQIERFVTRLADDRGNGSCCEGGSDH